MKILFSPIGGSDPINAGHDGSWLHCCRHYSPDLTEIYLSKEMLEREQKKQLYSKALKKLCNQTGQPISLRKTERPDLENPQLMDEFYDDFEQRLTALHQAYPDVELMVNISSGTPAMKGCLIHLYHILPFSVTLIQVDGPHTEMVNTKGSRAVWSPDFDLDEEWENNLDNLKDAANRCRIVKDEQQAQRLRVMQIEALIDHNEFYAAALLADELGPFLSEDVRKSLRAASNRQQLDLHNAGVGLNRYGFAGGSKLQTNEQNLLYQGAEMALTMQCDLERDDIAGYLRKLTPTLFSLLVSYLKKLGIDAARFTDSDLNYISESRLAASYPTFYGMIQNTLSRTTGRPSLKHDLLLDMIQALPFDSGIYDGLRTLRCIEKAVRNDVAHKPVKMTENDFSNKVWMLLESQRTARKKTDLMMERIRFLFEAIDPSLFNRSFWQGYDDMKAFLLEKLRRF